MPLTTRDKKTLRIASIGIALYLVFFFGLTGWKRLEKTRRDYTEMLATAQKVKTEAMMAENKILLLQKLQESFQFDPKKLNKTTLVAEVSAAIQKNAQQGGMQLGPVRESPARASAKELTSIQLEGVGPLSSVLGFCHQLETMGFPILIDSFQINPESTRPGHVKVILTLILLDYDQWKVAVGGSNV